MSSEYDRNTIIFIVYLSSSSLSYALLWDGVSQKGVIVCGTELVYLRLLGFIYNCYHSVMYGF